MTTQETTLPTFELSAQWVLAGHAVFTAHNASGKHYTFRVKRVQEEGKPAVWFASLLTGPDNEADGSYTYLGVVTFGGELRLTRASRCQEDSLPVQVLRFALRRIWTGRAASEHLPAGYGIHGEGRCGRCGRTLTVSESVYDGYGPECRAKMQG